jgi:hypothetical protein
MEIAKRFIVPILATILVVLASGMAGVGIVMLIPRLGGLATPLALGLPMVPCVLLLCWFKFDLMIFIAFALSSVVFIEPAPVDLLLVLLLVIGLVNGRLSMRRLENSSLIHLATWVLVLTNLFTLIQPYPHPRSVLFAAVSVYLLASMYLVKMYVTSPYHGHVILAGYWVAACMAVIPVIPAYMGFAGLKFAAEGLRAKGFFKDPNVYGPFLVPMFVLVLDELIDPVLLRVPAFIKGLTLIMITIGVFLSFSRAAWGNWALVVSLYVAVSLLKGRHVQRLLTVLSIAGAVALLLTIALLVRRGDLVGLLNRRLTLVERYDTSRFARHAEGIMTAFTQPTGLGPGMLRSAHQLYLRALAEQSVLGLLALLTLLLATTLGVFQAALSSNKVYGLSATALWAGLVGILGNSFFIDTVHWRHFYLLLGLSWAVSVGVAQSDWQEAMPKTAGRIAASGLSGSRLSEQVGISRQEGCDEQRG